MNNPNPVTFVPAFYAFRSALDLAMLCEVCGIYRGETVCFPRATPIVLSKMLPC